jgi:hypothetical protein
MSKVVAFPTEQRRATVETERLLNSLLADVGLTSSDPLMGFEHITDRSYAPANHISFDSMSMSVDDTGNLTYSFSSIPKQKGHDDPLTELLMLAYDMEEMGRVSEFNYLLAEVKKLVKFSESVLKND